MEGAILAEIGIEAHSYETAVSVASSVQGRRFRVHEVDRTFTALQRLGQAPRSTLSRWTP